MLEFAERAEAFPGLPATRVGGEEDCFDDVLREAGDLPAWVGELYLETHRGTYTPQSRTKKANRRSERLLREAEIWGSLAVSMGAELSLSPLKDAWQRVLVQQFHDILPGSSIGEVYVDALADYRAAQAIAADVRDAAMRWLSGERGLAGTLRVFNALSWSRSDPVEGSIVDPEEPFHLVDAAGCPCPVQVLSRGVEHAASIYGGAEFALSFGGNEMPGYHTGPACHLTYLTGARHSHLDSAGYSVDQKAAARGQTLTPEGVAEALLTEERWRQVLASLTVCFFSRGVYTSKTISRALSAIGLERSADDLSKLGIAILRRKHDFKRREGFDPAQLRISRRILETSSTLGPLDETFIRQAIQCFMDSV